MKDERHYKIGQVVYFPMTDERGFFRLVKTRVVGVSEEEISIYTYLYFIFVKDTLYRVHWDDLFLSADEFCKEVNARVVEL